MAGTVAHHEMINIKLAFDGNQGPFSDPKWCSPWFNEVAVLIPDRLLDKSASRETEIWVEISHCIQGISGFQCDFIYLKAGQQRIVKDVWNKL